MYQQLINFDGTLRNGLIRKIETNAFIPFVPANTDYQQFKLDLANGVQLQDAQGNVMTADQIKAFEATLP